MRVTVVFVSGRKVSFDADTRFLVTVGPPVLLPERPEHWAERFEAVRAVYSTP